MGLRNPAHRKIYWPVWCLPACKQPLLKKVLPCSSHMKNHILWQSSQNSYLKTCIPVFQPARFLPIKPFLQSLDWLPGSSGYTMVLKKIHRKRWQGSWVWSLASYEPPSEVALSNTECTHPHTTTTTHRLQINRKCWNVEQLVVNIVSSDPLCELGSCPAACEITWSTAHHTHSPAIW